MPDVTPAEWLTPSQKRWLLLLGVSLFSALIGRWLPGFTPPPLPDEAVKQIADTNAAIKRMESQVMKATGVGQ